MADHNSLSSPSQNQTKPISSSLCSPKFFNGFLPKGLSEIKAISPNSILDSNKTFPKFPDSFSGNKHSWEKSDPKGIGLVLIESLNDDKTDTKIPKPNTRRVLFGSKLNIQIPPLSSSFSPSESPKSPADFGIKTRNAQFSGSLSPFGSANSCTQTRDALSASEMELSEDYTCVISHGPNPRTTHIYDNCVLDSCNGVVGLSELKKDLCSLSENSNSFSESFLSFCYTCKKDLEQGKEINMCRGEKAFCSCQEMISMGMKIQN
ncbi:hypothetical protein Acr_17g0002930 [Actinidia rufa]|uniref:FLZ-type domain-containing protein n=1 Tax=Actinidia rufa TaxID=165716 RepID=A0A7J0G1R3_9ERIC|nr:hypothetical protein Acr_17g0002930 [Actinidia rufa]